MALLKNRFEQPYKLVDAHFNALTNLPKPVNILSSLQAFHDSLESHMRALSSLGTFPDTYSPMLQSSPWKASHRTEEAIHSRPP